MQLPDFGFGYAPIKVSENLYVQRRRNSTPFHVYTATARLDELSSIDHAGKLSSDHSYVWFADEKHAFYNNQMSVARESAAKPGHWISIEIAYMFDEHTSHLVILAVQVGWDTSSKRVYVAEKPLVQHA